MSAPKLHPAILIISDTAFLDPSTDKCASALRSILLPPQESTPQPPTRWTSPLIKIIPDDLPTIQHTIREWTSSTSTSPPSPLPPIINLILTSGGTGFTPRDITPEAITPLLDRPAPGLVHGMLAASLAVTPFAAMSRPVAGVRGKTVILTLPGSPKGASENLAAVVKLLPHACQQAAGEDSRVAHAKGVEGLEREAGLGGGGGGGGKGVLGDRTNGATTTNSATAASSSHGQGHDHSHSHHHHDHHHSHSGGSGHGHKVPRPHTTASERSAAVAAAAASPTAIAPKSNDPALGATHRARSSPYPMLSVSAAVSKILETTPSPAKPIHAALSPSLAGAVLAADVHAPEAVPAYRASIVDGYAVCIDDENPGSSVKGTFPVVSISHATTSISPPSLKPNTIARITTGAPLPPGATAVVMVEDTLLATSTPSGEEATVTILTDAITPGENVREPGSDVALGSLVLAKRTRLSSLGGEIGLLAAAGVCADIPVYPRPRVGVLSTGDEVTDTLTAKPAAAGSLRAGEIRDSNRPALLTLVGGWGVASAVVDLGIARDTPAGALEEAIRGAFRAHDLDVLITTGGVSMGELDLLKPTVERSLGGTVHFGRVAMKPGKPTTFASFDFKGDDGVGRSRLIFGLPGNPASALVTANLFVLPCLQKLAGVEGAAGGLQKIQVRVAEGEKIRCDAQRTEYHRVIVRCGADGVLTAISTGGQRSSRVGSVSAANALLVLPMTEQTLGGGDTCEALLMGPLLGL